MISSTQNSSWPADFCPTARLPALHHQPRYLTLSDHSNPVWPRTPRLRAIPQLSGPQYHMLTVMILRPSWGLTVATEITGTTAEAALKAATDPAAGLVALAALVRRPAISARGRIAGPPTTPKRNRERWKKTSGRITLANSKADPTNLMNATVSTLLCTKVLTTRLWKISSWLWPLMTLTLRTSSINTSPLKNSSLIEASSALLARFRPLAPETSPSHLVTKPTSMYSVPLLQNLKQNLKLALRSFNSLTLRAMILTSSGAYWLTQAVAYTLQLAETSILPTADLLVTTNLYLYLNWQLESNLVLELPTPSALCKSTLLSTSFSSTFLILIRPLFLVSGTWTASKQGSIISRTSWTRLKATLLLCAEATMCFWSGTSTLALLFNKALESRPSSLLHRPRKTVTSPISNYGASTVVLDTRQCRGFIVSSSEPATKSILKH